MLNIPRLWGSATPSALCRAWSNTEEVNLNRNQVEWERRARACYCTRTCRGSRRCSVVSKVWLVSNIYSKTTTTDRYLRKCPVCAAKGGRFWTENEHCERRRNGGVCQEEVEQIGSFKNSRWKIPARSSRKPRVNGLAKVPAERSELIPLAPREFQWQGHIIARLAGQHLRWTALNVEVQWIQQFCSEDPTGGMMTFHGILNKSATMPFFRKKKKKDLFLF